MALIIMVHSKSKYSYFTYSMGILVTCSSLILHWQQAHKRVISAENECLLKIQEVNTTVSEKVGVVGFFQLLLAGKYSCCFEWILQEFLHSV